MFLVDSNIWLELLLNQQKAEEVRQFLEKVKPDLVAITEFSLYSIGITTTRLNEDDLFRAFLRDTIERSGMTVIRLDIADNSQILKIRQQHNLDFDDAYQYVAADKHGLSLISFDTDFDRTERGRSTPAQALAML